MPNAHTVVWTSTKGSRGCLSETADVTKTPVQCSVRINDQNGPEDMPYRSNICTLLDTMYITGRPRQLGGPRGRHTGDVCVRRMHMLAAQLWSRLVCIWIFALHSIISLHTVHPNVDRPLDEDHKCRGGVQVATLSVQAYSGPAW